MTKASDERHRFSARLAQADGRGPYFVVVPARVSRSIGKRGPVPIVAIVNGVAEVRASLVPSGGGRHRLQLNAATRALAGARTGSRIAVDLAVDEEPTADPAPPDLVRALREAGAEAAFLAFPVGKQNHILRWIEEAAKDETRAKRIAKTVEVAERARERRADRPQARTGA